MPLWQATAQRYSVQCTEVLHMGAHPQPTQPDPPALACISVLIDGGTIMGTLARCCQQQLARIEPLPGLDGQTTRLLAGAVLCCAVLRALNQLPTLVPGAAGAAAAAVAAAAAARA